MLNAGCLFMKSFLLLQQMNLVAIVIIFVQVSSMQECPNSQSSQPCSGELQNKKSYKPIVLSGCSGVGKGTLVKYLLSKYPDLFELSVSLTTRQRRDGQTNGKQYNFVSKQQFESEVKKESFAEYCEVHGNYYGTHQGRLDDIVNRNKICILEIDLQGGEKIFTKRPDYNFIFVAPPSLEVLEQRLRHRGTQTEETIVKRMKNAKLEMEKVKQLPFYQSFMNDNLQKAEKDLLDLLNKKYGLSLGQ